MARVLATAGLLLLAAGVANAAVCQTYVVQAGDTISTIASMFNVQTSELDSALQTCINGYYPGVFLQPSQKICLPPWYSACASVRTAGGENSGFTDCKYYTVQAGDTLSSIADSLGLNLIDLQAVNPDGAALQVNQFVKLPGWYDGCPAPGDVQPCRYYVAQASDSLSSIAIAFSVNLDDIKAVNPDMAASDTATVLQPGVKVNIPPFDVDTCGAGVEVDKPLSGNCNVYRVQGGDTLYSIAAAFQTTTQQLLAINPVLAAGGILSTTTEIYIPPYVAEDCAAGIKYVTPEWIPDSSVSSQSLDNPADEAVIGAEAPAAEEAEDAAAPAPAPAFGRRLRI